MAKKQSRKKSTRRAASASGRRPAARKTAPKKTARGARGQARRTSRRRTGGQLSRTARSAKWIQAADDRADRPGQTLATRSHEVIEQWAERRGARPATIPGGDRERPRVLRFDFPGFGGQSLQPVEWDRWFRTFDDRNLVFLFQDRLRNGNQSNFFRLDNPSRKDA